MRNKSNPLHKILEAYQTMINKVTIQLSVLIKSFKGNLTMKMETMTVRAIVKNQIQKESIQRETVRRMSFNRNKLTMKTVKAKDR